MIVAIVAWQTDTQAQFDSLFEKKEGAAKNTAASDKNVFDKSSEQVAENVLAARIAFLDAKAKMMEALGLKSEAVAKASEALQAKKGVSNAGEIVDAIKDSNEVSEEAAKQLADSMAHSEELSAESKAKFAEGGGKFIEGAILEKEQIETIQKLVQQGQGLVSSAGPFEKVGVLSLVEPVTALSAIVPGDVKEAVSTLSKMVEFAKSQKIEIPNAEQAIEKLGAL